MASGDAAVRIEVQFKAHRCLRTRSTWAHCQSCAATCPSGAIDFAREAKPGEPPAFNASRCLHCGACLSSCQHDAFVAKYFSESKATRRIAEQDPDVVRCFLPFGEIAALSSKAKCYQISTCLASLTPGTLFEIAFARPRILATSKCAGCYLGKRVLPQIALNVKTARLLLEEWGKQDNLLVTSAQGPLKGIPESDPPSQLNGASMPNAAANRVRRVFSHIARGEASPTTGKMDLPTIYQHESSWRNVIRSYWQTARPGQISGSAYLWPEHHVDAYACEGCGMCAQICPSASIRHFLGDGKFSYQFTPGTCVNCELCAVVCARKAIFKQSHPLKRPFDEVICFERAATTCPRCNGPIFEGEEVGGLCPTCAREFGIERNG